MTNLERKIRNVATLALITVGTVGCGQSVVSNEDLSRLRTLTAPTPTADLQATVSALQTKVAEAPCVSAKVEPTATATATTRPVETRKPVAIAPATATATAIATATRAETARISCEHVTNEAASRAVVFEGFPSRAIQVLNPSMDARFKGTWTAGLDMMVAEPGVLAIPDRFEKIDHMPYTTMTGVGGYTGIVLQEGIVEYQGRDGKIRRIELPELQGRTHMLLFREGFNINNNRPVQLTITCAVEQHGQVQHFVPGAFVSEGQMGQVSLGVFTGKNLDGTPNGNTANSMFTVTEVDWNTDAFAVGSQFGMGQPFRGEKQNWK